MRTLCIEDGCNIIGIAPFRLSHYGFKSPFGYDSIEPLAYRASMPEGADYTGLILSQRDTECVQSLLKHLFTYDDWDFLQIYDVRGDSAIPGLLRKMSESVPRFDLIEGRSCPYITLPSSVDTLMQKLGRKFRHNLRWYRRKLQKDCGHIELKRYDQFGSVAETMNIFFQLHQERWKDLGLPGVFATQEMRGFYTDVAMLFANKGWLGLYLLTTNDEPIAVQYGFEYERRMYNALGGFDPAYAKYSVGNLICLGVIERSIDRGLEEYDFMKGGEAYKFVWTSENRRNVGIRFVNRKLASSIRDVGLKVLGKTKGALDQ
jgi:CelD/BcsL family acetyltransferase involved in cellulose biosynthesis